ncbi:MAG: copper homeostasis protein CutC [Asticcacaulis sp.]|uniref:copper homeostasis protein CutC n=1 Tax=Asticcacaulis sp. TaxID=1872648 RepID=UPI0039E413AF
MPKDLHTAVTAPLLEVVVDTAAGLRTAMDHGADRIELVAALVEGGLTPSGGLMRLAAESGNERGIPTRAMIRPRAGDFTYTADELHIMHNDIVAAASCGLEGVVLGANLTSGALDEAALKGLVIHAKAHNLAVALHRGFDLAPDLSEALETAISLGIDAILTSGGGQTAAQGTEGLAMLVKQAAGRIEIMAGKGITAENVGPILETGVTAIHASCNAPIPPHDNRAFALGYVNANMRDTDAQAVAHLRSILTSRGKA